MPGVNQDLLRMDNYQIDKSKDTLFRGEFEVVKELIAAFDDGAASKRECDKVIDKNGPKPKGTGIKQLRENIAESKLSYEIMDDAAQAFLKTKIMDNIQKYFYLICYTGYLREQSRVAKDGVTEEQKKIFALTGGKVSTPTENLKVTKTFQAWMDDHANLRTMIQEGKDGLEWYRCKRSSILPQSSVPPRTVDPAKMQTVEAMIKAPDHREKMPHIIKTILEFAFLTYSGRSDQ